MPDSTELKQKPSKKGRLLLLIQCLGLFPRPRTMGSFVIIVTALAFFAGWMRNELLLFLLGTLFLITLLYCFLGVFTLGLIHRAKARSMSISLLSETVNIGILGEFSIKIDSKIEGKIDSKNEGKIFWRLPAIFVRCKLCLETRDGRFIRGYADPAVEKNGSFPVKERGAYYSDLLSGERDSFLIFDAPGFFCLSLPISRSTSPRLFAVPAPAEEPVPLSLKSGGSEQRTEKHYLKSDELTDHRPYVPGDDPRRINWKLYSHAPLGELFVREGEPLPPPHSKLLILLDTEADNILYTLDEGRRAVDLLCENALAAALNFSGQGMNISIGYTGGRIIEGPMNAAELASALAWPAAICLPNTANLPNVCENSSVLLLALPRISSASSALDRFLKNSRAVSYRNRKGRAATELVFLYDAQSKLAAELEDTARFCVNLYRGKPGIHARIAAVSAGRGWEGR